MYDLNSFGDGYYAVGGGPIDSLVEMIQNNAKVVLGIVVVLILLVVALFFGYMRPYKKEGLVSGAMASLGIGGAKRSDYGTPDEMVLQLNYGSSEGFTKDPVREAKGLGLYSANTAAAVIPGQPCDKQILEDSDAYGWMIKQAYAPAESYAQPNDAQLTASMKGY